MSKRPSSKSVSGGKQLTRVKSVSVKKVVVNPKSRSNSAARCQRPRSRTNSKSSGKNDKPTKENIKLKPEGVIHSSSSNRFDCMALLVHCGRHNRVLVSNHTVEPDKANDPTVTSASWMPFTQLAPNRSWKHGAMWALCVTLAGGDSNGPKFRQIRARQLPIKAQQCIQVSRVQVPQTRKFYSRITYYFELSDCGHDSSCQPIGDHLEWISLTEVQTGGVPNLWGPELVEFSQLIQGESNRPPTAIVEFYLEDAFLFVPRDPPRNLEEELLQSLRITEKTVERLYADFQDHCFPAMYQTLNSFRAYMARYDCGWTDEAKVGKLFGAFNVSGSGYLNFHELLMGLACVEPTSQHGEFRVKFLFRYYNIERSNQLSPAELRSMLTDMGTAPDQLDQKVRDTIAIVGGPKATVTDLIVAIGTYKFRGTSVLCRSSKSIFSQISRAISQKSFHHQTAGRKQLSGLIRANASLTDVCSVCSSRNYELATHVVQYNIQGSAHGRLLPEVAGKSNSVDSKTNPFTSQQYSLECVFSASSAANAALKVIREFNSVKGTAEEPIGLMQDRSELLWRLLLSLYNDVTILLDHELKCQKVGSPCYIIGDVHGNLEDLLSMERVLWNTIPVVNANFVFLGDYVDRGQWGLECTMYLVAFKILCPTKVTLLRGNHEVRELQTHYTYKQECLFKYDEELGSKVWELTNRIYDRLPVCAAVDEAIFCAHGGIPRSAQKVDQIAAVQREVRDPEEESAVVWEILWSDPCPLSQFIDVCDQRGLDPDGQGGYVFNVKRGTAFLFSDTGATGFLRNNFMTHIVRAHEVAPIGYRFHFGCKCATIFSCSHYCGNENLCGLVLAADQRLRVIVIDTANNSAATD